MKKKYSTLLNFALATCVATTLVACTSDGDITGSTGGTYDNPVINIGGKVYDSNGMPLSNVRVSCQNKIVQTNELGDWNATGLRVTNVAGADEDTAHAAISCTVEAPAGYLGATVMVMPEAQLDGTTWPLEAGDGLGSDDIDIDVDCEVSKACGDFSLSLSGDGGDVTLHIDNPRTTFINGMYVEATPAYLPAKQSQVCGVLRNCSTDEPLKDVNMKADLGGSSQGGPIQMADYHGGKGRNGIFSYTSYTTPMMHDQTEADGSFCIDMLANDSYYTIMAEGMNNLQANYATWCSDDWDLKKNGDWKETWCKDGLVDVNPNGSDALEGLSFNTSIEGTVLLGDLCASNVTTGDIKDPCLVNVDGIVGSRVKVLTTDECETAEDGDKCDDFDYGLLDDDLDGTAATGGIKINFTESMDPDEIDPVGGVNSNSILVYNHSIPDYVDFTYTMSGKTLTINLDAALGDDDYITIYLLKPDFKDMAGNMLTYYKWSLSGHCPIYDSNEQMPFNDEYIDWEKSVQGNWYFTISLKRFSPDDIDPGEVGGLQQVCAATSNFDAGLDDLNKDYPLTFYTASGNIDGNFYNLNKDDDYADRLEGLADAVGGVDSHLASLMNGSTNVSFVTPVGGQHEVCTKDPGETSFSCGSSVNNTGGLVKTYLTGVKVGTMVQINILDDLGNYSSVSDVIILDDCVSPTTVLNYAYNTCGHLAYSMGGYTRDHDSDDDWGYDTDYFAHVVSADPPWGLDNCAIGADVGRENAGGGGENSREGLRGDLGIPTLNITCRLLKDYNAVPNSLLRETTIWGLYEGTNAWDQDVYSEGYGSNMGYADYDATTFAGWGPFADTIGVAFSENIAVVEPVVQPVCEPACNADIEIDTVLNDQSTGDDGDSGADGHPSSAYNDADLLLIDVDDVVKLANEDHLTLVNFNNSVVDEALTPLPAANANVIINDLLPPLVEYAFFGTDGLVIQFNEAVSVTTFDDNNDCTDGNDPPTGPYPSHVILQGFNGASDATIYMNCATVSTDGTLVTIPSENLQGLNRDDLFPPDSAPVSNVYDEPTISAYTDESDGPYNHGLMDWSTIEDANNGNSWQDWVAGGDYLDINGNQQCITPEFAVVDVLGEFDTVRQSVNPFGNGIPSCASGAGRPFDTTFLIEFNQPLDIAALTNNNCTGTDETAACASSEMDSTWVGTYVQFSSNNEATYTSLSSQSFVDPTTVNGTLSSDAKTLRFTFENDCRTYTNQDFFRFNKTTVSTFGGNTLGAIAVGAGN